MSPPSTLIYKWKLTMTQNEHSLTLRPLCCDSLGEDLVLFYQEALVCPDLNPRPTPLNRRSGSVRGLLPVRCSCCSSQLIIHPRITTCQLSTCVHTCCAHTHVEQGVCVCVRSGSRKWHMSGHMFQPPGGQAQCSSCSLHLSQILPPLSSFCLPPLCIALSLSRHHSAGDLR